MIEEYFRKQKESLLNDKLTLEKDHIRVDNQIMETVKFIDLLEEKSDPNFESFTPREVNVKNRNEIKDLQEELKKLQKEKNNLLVKIDECKSKIEEFDSFLHCVKKEKIKLEEEKQYRHAKVIDNLEILNYVSCENEKNALVITNSILNPIVDVNQKIKRITQFIDMDRERAKLELQQLGADMSVIENSIRIMLDQDRLENKNGGIEKYLTKVVEHYNQENRCELHVELDINESTIDYEIPVLQAVCKMLKKIIEDMLNKNRNICITITPTENMNMFVISMKLVNLEDSVLIKSKLINDRYISIYTYLLSILIDYNYDESGNFIVSFKY